MNKIQLFLLVAVLLCCTTGAWACEPVLPFMHAMVPISLSGSLLMLVVAVAFKCALFAVFERRISHVQAAWRMFVGNVLTTVIGVVVAAMIASGPTWVIGAPLALILCWLPSRRLVRAAPTPWLRQVTPAGIAMTLTFALLASCILFMMGQGAVQSHQLSAYWVIKVAAIFLALLGSMSLTTIWEEWVIWRLSSRPDGAGFYPSVLRANLYVLVLILAMPAAMILPKRLKSPDFLAKRSNTLVSEANTR